ncbi:chaplin [Streptomyces sp. NPDC059578]|uniref:chaplin n=1 Tax=unclassified Streptomyces TaxID=2593676 RepID=UPI00365CE8BD
MKRVARNGLIAAAVASGAVVGAAPAFADAAADGAAVGSPGAVSGNTIQLPVHVPVNACGNTVNVVGLLNPAAGNTCANRGGSEAAPGGYGDPAAPGGQVGSGTSNGGGSTAEGAAVGSPGVISGNGVQLPIDLPVNVSGNSVNVVGVGNPVFGNHSENVSGPKPPEPPVRPEPPVAPKPEKPPVKEPVKHAPEQEVKPPATVVPEQERVEEERTEAPEGPATLAQTGADDPLALVAPAGLALLGGALLRRRFRASRKRGD